MLNDKKRNKIFNEDVKEWIRVAAAISIFLIPAFTENVVIWLWALSLFMQDVFVIRVYDVYIGQLDSFPPELYGKPRWISRVFKYAGFDESWIPQLAIHHMYIVFSMTILLNLLFLFISFMTSEELRMVLLFGTLAIYVMSCILLILYLSMRASYICYIYKFKKVTRTNLKYLLRRILLVNAADKEPSVQNLGSCIILNKNRGNVEVQIIKTKVVYKDVLLTHKKEYSVDKLWKLKEICGVRYIE